MNDRRGGGCNPWQGWCGGRRVYIGVGFACTVCNFKKEAMPKKKYIIVTGRSTEILEDDVNEQIDNGYYPTGAMVTNSYGFAQAMVLVILEK